MARPTAKSWFRDLVPNHFLATFFYSYIFLSFIIVQMVFMTKLSGASDKTFSRFRLFLFLTI